MRGGRRDRPAESPLPVSGFTPIAIVGQGCVLPGCPNPSSLWDAVIQRRVLIGASPPGRWRLDPARYLRAAAGEHSVSPLRVDAGGYVDEASGEGGLEGLEGEAGLLRQLDPVFTWTARAARQALKDAGLAAPAERRRAGLILGNLSYPTRAFARCHEHAVLGSWLREAPPHPANRFMSGLPARMAAKALGLEGPAFALDAACASGLYAIKLACDQLAEGACDLMLAGGVNASDNLFIQAGFATLGALSPTGRSRPFHREADGLVPSEGAAFVALKRLEDAERDGDVIAGVIRGIGLSNDGRAGGFLSPSAEGQVRAMRAAFASCPELSPGDIGLIECHATGTPAGDGVEIRSLREVYGPDREICLTALKANLGHSITTSAVAGLLKVLAAIREGVLPPTPNAFPLLPELGGSGCRVLEAAAPWPGRSRRAAISAFGMGGNNAHLLLEAWAPGVSRGKPPVHRRTGAAPVVIVGLNVRTQATAGLPAFAQALLDGSLPAAAPPEEAAFDPRRLGTPPKDLQRALGQQLLILEAANAALAEVAELDGASAGVFIGMQADAEINRHALRARLADRLRESGHAPSESWLAAARNAIQEVMEPADVVGTMPNIPANRLNHAHNLRGQGFTVSAEEESGLVALSLAAAALARGEITSAVVGAVDLCREACHEWAARQYLGIEKTGDAAVVLVLKTRAEAERAGDPVLAEIDLAGGGGIGPTPLSGVAALFGHAHAASGLLDFAAELIARRHGARWDAAGCRLVPRLSRSAPAAPFAALRAARGGPGFLPLPQVAACAGTSPDDLRRRLDLGEMGGDGPCRIAWIEPGAAGRGRREEARAWLARAGTSPAPPPVGIHFFGAPVGGELAFAFTGAAAAYPGMGRELLVALPETWENLDALRDPENAAGWVFEASSPRRGDPLAQLAGASFLCQVHAQLSQRILGLRPDAALGLSSGETNALFALGRWGDMDALLGELSRSELYTRHLGGDFQSVREHWGVKAGERIEWENWVVRAPAARVRAAVAAEERCYLTIVQAPAECVLAGDRAACRRVLAALGAPASPLGHDIAVHCPAVAPFAEAWRRIHTRPVSPGAGPRLYSNYLGGSYAPDTAAVAEALTGQALQTVDFPRVIERAWSDGVRIFVEHGPRAQLTQAIGAILGSRPHLAVALDAPGRSSLLQAADAAARLWAAGVAVDLSRWTRPQDGAPSNRTLRVPLRRSPVRLPRLEDAEPRQVPAAPPLLAVAATAALGRGKASPPETTAAPWHERLLQAQRDLLLRQQEAQAALIALQSRLSAPALVPAGPERRGAREAEWTPSPALPPTGPAWSRAQLEILAGGKISSVFGPQFADQDDYPIQVRMPEPPLLLCDRVTGIAGEPGSMGRGIVWTETDVREDSWYLHHGRMPAGIFIEAGQADLLLISWLGADRLNRGQRAYRLLGCELVFHDSLPCPGETLCYQIHVDGHARQGDVRLFFFHYDCRIGGRTRISVRHGQAGFFTPEELAGSGGVIWSAAEAPYAEPGRLDPPPRPSGKRAFSASEVEAFAAGELAACFGAEFDAAAMHTRTPAIQSGSGNLIGAVTAFDPRGGPAGRGWLRAERPLSADDWFFAGHFKNDPCMPGTLMAEGCLQAMAFYLAALGYTLDRDGWRFEPVTDARYTFVCRGQATPQSRELVYEVFVDECGLVDGRPTLAAHVLCTVDGLKAFKCERLALRLVRDYPLSSTPRSALRTADSRLVARIGELELDHASLLACAFGSPLDAFGPAFRPFLEHGRSPRLPGPPYHFCTRVARVAGEPGSMRAPAAVEMLYDIPPDAWYFAENSEPVMPFCVLLETALQPCGWLATYVLDPAAAAWEPLYRNLDGAGTLQREIRPGDGTITTRVELKSIVALGPQIILRFAVACSLAGEDLFACETSFGFFTPKALSDTRGLPPTDDERRSLALPPNRGVDLATFVPASGYALPRGRLARLDRLAGIWPALGRNGLGYARAEKAVSKGDWTFKAHFFQDPVQPGSIGVESLLQLLKLFIAETEPAPAGMRLSFESVLLGAQAEWKYRGQVLPHHTQVEFEIEILERTPGPGGTAFVAEGRLWVDGRKIYHLARIGTRVRHVPARPAPGAFHPGELKRALARRIGNRAEVLQDLFQASALQFVSGLTIDDPEAFAAEVSRPCLYLANHQVAIESMLFIALVDAATGIPCRAVAKVEHRDGWMAAINGMIRRSLGREALLLFDRSDQKRLLEILEEFTAGLAEQPCSLLAHVQGTRSLRAGEPVESVSSAFLDLALRHGLPIRPVRFSGGLPREPAKERLEFPIGFGRQHYHIGAAIPPERLRPLNLLERKAAVCRALNGLGAPLTEETPAAPDAAFAARVQALERGRQVAPAAAVLLACLQQMEDRSERTEALLRLVAGAEPAGSAASDPEWAALARFLGGGR